MVFIVCFAVAFIAYAVVAYFSERSREELEKYPTANNLYKELGQIINKIVNNLIYYIVIIGTVLGFLGVLVLLIITIKLIIFD